MWDIIYTGGRMIGGIALLFASISQWVKTKNSGYILPSLAGLAMAVVVAADYLSFYAANVDLLGVCSDYLLLGGGVVVYFILLRTKKKPQQPVEIPDDGSSEVSAQNTDAEVKSGRVFPFAASAFGLAEVAMFALSFFFAAIVYVTFHPWAERYPDEALTMIRPILCGYTLTVPLSLTGIVLGIVAFRRIEQNRVLAGIGITLSSVFLCIFAVFILFFLMVVLPRL
jgi:hypothetical protein